MKTSQHWAFLMSETPEQSWANSSGARCPYCGRAWGSWGRECYRRMKELKRASQHSRIQKFWNWVKSDANALISFVWEDESSDADAQSDWTKLYCPISSKGFTEIIDINMWRNRGFIWAWTTKVWEQNQQLHRRSDTRSLMTFSRVPCGDHSPRERKRPGSYLGKSWICRSRQFSRTVPALSTSLSPVLCHFSSWSGRHLSVRVWIFSRNADCCYLTVPTWYWPSMFNIFYLYIYIYMGFSIAHVMAFY